MIGELKDVDADSRGEAIDALLEVFEPFEGEPAEAGRAHAEAARAPNLEDDELIEELAGFLHVAGHSDAFGFDMLGWIAHPGPDQHEAMFVEVKSSIDGTFHLSPNEWRCAEDFASDYCVLVVQRAAMSAVPQRLDLLADPVQLVAEEQLSKTPDGYLLGYVAKLFVKQLQDSSASAAVYAELPGTQHSFDLFHSISFENVVDAIKGFLVGPDRANTHKTKPLRAAEPYAGPAPRRGEPDAEVSPPSSGRR